MSRGKPPAVSTDTPEMIRIRKAQEQLSEVLQLADHGVGLCLENAINAFNLIPNSFQSAI